jgi:predicted nucleotidyltransferase
MGNQTLPQDFREFLRLLNKHGVDYLLIGGYAVGYHGYPRTTADMDVWTSIGPENAQKLVDVFNEFGMKSPDITPELFMTPGNIVRMGVPPVRIEVLNEIDGVTFSDCSANATIDEIDGVRVSLISLADLKRNKKASGRHKDLDDLEHLFD